MKRYQRAVLLIHWTKSAPGNLHGVAECGARSIHFTRRTENVTCPRCTRRRDFKEAYAARELDRGREVD